MKSLDDYKKELEKLYAASQAEDIAASDKKYETEKKLTTDQYNRQINETENSYEDLYRENAVQKLINEREVAENMANLGLTDSGLNRTQQTAVQLSYANNKNKIDTTRQKAVDQLTYSLADAISKLDTAKTEAAAGIKSNYASAIASGAQEMYNKALAEETERIKSQNEYDLKMAELSAQQKANTPYYKFVRTGIGDNGKTQYYFEDQNGNIKYYDEGINPYTGSPISGYTKEQLKKLIEEPPILPIRSFSSWGRSLRTKSPPKSPKQFGAMSMTLNTGQFVTENERFGLVSTLSFVNACSQTRILRK